MTAELFPTWPIQATAGQTTKPSASTGAEQTTTLRAELAVDPCARKHGHDENSDAAWERLAPFVGAARAKVLVVLRLFGQNGATSREVAQRMGVERHCISGRFGELKKLGYVARKLGVKRHGSAVWIALEKRDG